MTLNEYQELAARTDSEAIEKFSLMMATMGMVGEAAEALDHMKKVFEQGHPLDYDKIIEEAGDCLWYIAKTARNCGVSLEELAQRNVDKLRRRYPDGFSVERSRNREDVWHD
jgi:NTP pyrophosphatase (non-canonical NTP hydrolase)